ncbi:MAG: hypothetical protein KAI66_21295 [Lentisphaeria bacterium]|nr:hypothetical protein [Lentisphaeria bacterium]
MNARERFLRIMRYEPVDRLPVLAMEPFEQSAIERWHREGLPTAQSPVEFLGLDQLVYIGGVGVSPDPPFEEKTLHEDEQYIVMTTGMGATVQRDKTAPSTFYGHIDHPIKTREDWERYKWRLDPNSPGRIRKDWGPALIRRFNESPNPVGLCFFPFFFRLGFYTMGMERFLMAFHDMPDMVHDMFACGSRLCLAGIRRIPADVKIDFALFNEDLAGKNGPLISPRTYAEFWYPHQDPIMQALQDRNVPVVCQWSAGQFDALLPDMLEHGFNCTWPLERIAGMDASELRKRYGRKLLLGGNISKEALLAGPAAIDQELDQLMPLIEAGGFLPALDDMPPMECPFDHYRHLTERLRSLRLG